MVLAQRRSESKPSASYNKTTTRFLNSDKTSANPCKTNLLPPLSNILLLSTQKSTSLTIVVAMMIKSRCLHCLPPLYILKPNMQPINTHWSMTELLSSNPLCKKSRLFSKISNNQLPKNNNLPFSKTQIQTKLLSLPKTRPGAWFNSKPSNFINKCIPPST